jgi:hypothetical protein
VETIEFSQRTDHRNIRFTAFGLVARRVGPVQMAANDMMSG